MQHIHSMYFAQYLEMSKSDNAGWKGCLASLVLHKPLQAIGNTSLMSYLIQIYELPFESSFFIFELRDFAENKGQRTWQHSIIIIKCINTDIDY